MLQRPRTAPMRADRRRRRRRKANRNGSDTRGTAGNSDGFGSSDPATSPWSPSSHSSRPLSSGFKKYHDGGGGGRNRHHLQSSSSSSLAASSRVVQSAGRFRQGKSKSKSPSSSSSSSPASSPGYRPRTAPAPGSRKSHRKEAHMSIQVRDSVIRTFGDDVAMQHEKKILFCRYLSLSLSICLPVSLSVCFSICLFVSRSKTEHLLILLPLCLPHIVRARHAHHLFSCHYSFHLVLLVFLLFRTSLEGTQATPPTAARICWPNCKSASGSRSREDAGSTIGCSIRPPSRGVRS